MAKSRWFTRGWTLQELLAPPDVVFFDQDWDRLSNRNSISTFLSDITGIYIGALKDPSTIRSYSAAQRMSWVASRETTMPDDMAYCLAGIFKVRITVEYGRGSNAFDRLQQEILRVTEDQTILAWEQLPGGPVWTGAFAPSTLCFRNLGSLVKYKDILDPFPHPKGHTEKPLKLSSLRTYDKTIYLVGLKCYYQLQVQGSLSKSGKAKDPKGPQLQVWIMLRQIGETTYKRAHSPASLTLLNEAYVVDRGPTDLDVQIITEDPSDNREAQTHGVLGPTIGQTLTADSTGILILPAWGEMMEEIGLFKESSFPQSFALMPLKNRASSAVSHALISNGTYTVLISVAWDLHNQYLRSSQTAFLDPQMQSHRQMQEKEHWNDLFGYDDVRAMHTSQFPDPIYLTHCKVREEYGHVHGEVAPTVSQDPRSFEDMRGHTQVLFTAVFKDTPY